MWLQLDTGSDVDLLGGAVGSTLGAAVHGKKPENRATVTQDGRLY